MSIRLTTFISKSNDKNVQAVLDILNGSYVRDTTALGLLEALAERLMKPFTVHCYGDYELTWRSVEYLAEAVRNGWSASKDSVEWLDRILWDGPGVYPDDIEVELLPNCQINVYYLGWPVCLARPVDGILPEGWEDWGGSSDPFLSNPVLLGNRVVACSEMGGSPVVVIDDVRRYIARHIVKKWEPDYFSDDPDPEGRWYYTFEV